MKRAGGLPSSERIKQPRNGGIQSGRHCQDRSRSRAEKDKDDQQVCEALEHIV
jgi:hypothetical protein